MWHWWLWPAHCCSGYNLTSKQSWMNRGYCLVWNWWLLPALPLLAVCGLQNWLQLGFVAIHTFQPAIRGPEKTSSVLWSNFYFAYLFTLHTALLKPPMNALFWDLPAQLILSLPSIIWIWYRFQTHFVIDENHFHFLNSHSQADLEIEKEWVRGHRASSEERSAHPVVSEVVRLPPERQSKKVKVKMYRFSLWSEVVRLSFDRKIL